MGIFDLNEQAIIVQESFMGSNLYYIDDFYKHPDGIVKYLDMTPNVVHHPNKKMKYQTLNGICFDDRRHNIKNKEITPVYNHLSKICGHIPISMHKDDSIITNKTRFFKSKFNDYKNNYWHPHTDPGYTALIYLNKSDSECGTNLYKRAQLDLPYTRGEHVDPWRSKENWEIITTLKSNFNRCVLFDGNKFAHGMHICDDRYFDDQYRLNQVLFFGNKRA